MGRIHTAIAATLTSFIIFGTLLASNYALYASEEQRAVLYELSDRANRVSVDAELAKGLVALSFLRASQAMLEASGMQSCRHPLENLGSLHSLPFSQSLGGVDASLRGSFSAGGAVSDNLTLLSPFDGFVPGYLNFAIRVNLDLSTPFVTYHKAELHYLHLPILYERSITVCLSVLDYLHSRFLEIKRPSAHCATPSILGAVRDANRVFSSVASLWGLTLSVSASSYGLEGFGLGRNGLGRCPTVAYQVVVSQQNVPGVSGDFTWSVFERGSLSQ